ncbi:MULTISPECIES: hypothetical protein [Microbacterium]|uniref:hypothetical protein n=1 Tax=Microbacterium TaxID=33882 RepID=UPI00217D5B64|nr:MULTISPECIES: hypothetical protein [Microbacterium]UWF78218.1 hypothetical protein JSY13_04115 [Microbacterium neungamense]WCM56390.1 hypothetical protein JRG78_04120 [Microbacterium sp. EF45047]
MIHAPVPRLADLGEGLGDSQVMFAVAYLMVAALFLAKWFQDRVTKQKAVFSTSDEATMASL